MSDIERAKKALVNAHNAGDVESARKLASFIKQSTSKTEQLSRDLAFLNRGIASTLGLPVDMAAAGLKKLGVIDDASVPLGGSKNIERGMDRIASYLGYSEITPREGEQPETLTAKTLRGVGEAGGALLPVGLGAQALARGSGVVAKGAQKLLTEVAKRPVAATGLELTSGAGAGLGEVGGRALTDGTEYETAGGMLGALAGGIAAPASVSGALRYNAPSLAYRATKKAVAPFTKAGAMARAEDAIQGAVSSPEQARLNLNKERVSDNLSLSQRTESPELMALESRVADVSPQASTQRLHDIARAREDLTRSLRGTGSAQDAVGEVSARVDRILENSQRMADEAQASLQQRLQSIEPSQRGSQAAVVAREELENALQSARQQENALWENIPGAGIPTANLKRKFFELEAKIPKAQRDEIPKIAKDMLGNGGAFKNAENIQELQGLRSRLLQESRVARAAGQYNSARISDQIADDILDHMGASTNNIKGPVGQAIRDALDYSRGVNETFKRGSVGRVLSPDRLGADRVAPERTLEAILGAGKIRGDVGLQDVLAAAPSEKMADAARDYMLGRLNASSVRDGVLNPVQAEKFLRDNVDILDKMPSVRDNIADAVKMQRDVDRLTGRANQLKKSLSSPQKSVAARIIGSQVDNEIASIMTSKNPREAARQLRLMVRGNSDAVSGLEAGAMDFLIGKSKTGTVDAFGNEVISGNKMLKSLMDKRTRDTMRELLGADGLNRAEKIAYEMSILDSAESVSALNKIIDDAPNAFIEMIGTTAGARFGAQLGVGTSGASLKTASMMSEKAKQILKTLTGSRAEGIIVRAMHDKELFEALLTTKTKTTAGRKEAAKKLESWLLGVGENLIKEEDGENQ